MEDPDLARVAQILSRIWRVVAPPESLRRQIICLSILPLLRFGIRAARRLRNRAALETAATAKLILPPALPDRDGRVLLISLAHIGDFVLGLPAIKTLRDAFPNAQFSIVCGSWNVTWAREIGWFDEVIAFNFFTELNRDWTYARPEQYAEFTKLLAGRSFDIAVDLRYDSDTRPLLYRVNASFRAGYAAPEEPGLPKLDLMLPTQRHMGEAGLALHASLRFMALADAVIAALAVNDPHSIKNLVSQTHHSFGSSSYAVLSIGAGDPIRQWSMENFATLARLIDETFDLDIIILGGHAEADQARAIADALASQRVHLAIGLPLRDVPSLLSAATAYVGLGSGMSHISAVLGVPTVTVLSGVSNVETWKPLGPRAVSLFAQTPCYPCGLRQIDECAFGVRCLTAITPNLVVDAMAQVLKSEQDNSTVEQPRPSRSMPFASATAPQ